MDLFIKSTTGAVYDLPMTAWAFRELNRVPFALGVGLTEIMNIMPTDLLLRGVDVYLRHGSNDLTYEEELDFITAAYCVDHVLGYNKTSDASEVAGGFFEAIVLEYGLRRGLFSSVNRESLRANVLSTFSLPDKEVRRAILPELRRIALRDDLEAQALATAAAFAKKSVDAANIPEILDGAGSVTHADRGQSN